MVYFSADIVTRIGAAYHADPRPAAHKLFDLRFELFSRTGQTTPWLAYCSLRVWLRRRTVRALQPLPTSGSAPLVLANAHTIHHIRRLEDRMRAVLTASVRRVDPATPVIGVTFQAVRLSRLAALALAFRATLAAVRMGRLAARTGAVDTIPAVLAAVGRLDAVAEYLYNQGACDVIAANARAIVTLNENWLPESQLIRAANRQGVPTLHYPHGLLGALVLPLVSSHQLFWNERMAASFGPPARAVSVVGFLEGYRAPPPPDIHLRYDVLITSQYHGYRIGLTDDPAALRAIFSVWAEVLESQPDLRCVIKLHPSDSDEDRGAIHEIFARLADRVLVVGGDTDLRWLLHGCRVHSTVSSGSVITATQMNKPTFLYGDSALIRANLPERFCHFRTADDLLALLRTASELPQAAWLDPDWTDRSFDRVIESLLGGD
jgi:hypothetical protein